MASRNDTVAEVSVDELRRLSHILGEGSASAKALADLERRRYVGEDAYAYRQGRTIIVGPKMTQGE